MRMVAGLALLLTVAALGAGSCGNEITKFPNDGGGGSAGTTTTTPQGGEGGETPTGCDDCPDSAPICFDDQCVSACPQNQVVCHTDADPNAASICCPAMDQCCNALANGYPADVCASATAPCPTLCPDGVTYCSGYCMLDAVSGTYGCTDTCGAAERVCGDLCCPLGSRCENGSCPLPDISADAARIASSAQLDHQTFGMNSCEMVEGCIAASGDRTLLRFDLRTPNEGAGDMFMGDPQDQTDLFQYSPCHNHYHFNTYAAYRLLDMQMQVVATGHKQAFCLIDIEQWDPNANNQAIYDCGYQGIQAGWADVYHSGLDCQWVDVTDVPAGEYLLEVTLNTDQIIAESDYTNNIVTVPVTIAADSCPGGCATSFDTTCCVAGNPCNLEANTICDCGGLQPWDAAECSSCYGCDVGTTCPGGCTLPSDPCCDSGNSCSNQNNGVCDCQGNFSWDSADCDTCISGDPECPAVNSCPSGCGPFNPNDPCCGQGNTCGWDGDGWCDCGGIGWDFVDCFSCPCN